MTVRRLGKYQIESVIGRGGMGVIYKAYDPDMCRHVAIKTLRTDLFGCEEVKDLVKRFKGEAKAYGRLLHPNIVACYSCDEAEGLVFIVMEFVAGVSLQRWLADNHRFTVENTLDIVRQLLSALSYAHANRVIHRDIKPGNILLMEGGHVKVADFGVAKVDATHVTQTGYIVGSPDYMSPEQFLGKNVDSRSDLFSAGVILYQLLTGTKPFQGDDLGQVLHNVLNFTPRVPSSFNPEISAELDNIVMRAIEKKPEDRFQGAGEFIQAVDQLPNVGKDETLLIDGVDLASTKPQSGIHSEKHERKKPDGPGIGKISTGIIIFLTFVFISVFFIYPIDQDLPESTASSSDGGKASEDKAIREAEVPQADMANILDAEYECSRLISKVDGESISVYGFVSRERDISRLRSDLSQSGNQKRILVNVEIQPWPYCELIALLQPYLPEGEGLNSRYPVVKQFVSFLEDEYLQLDLVSPPEKAYLYVDYFLIDGTVVHMFPNPTDKDNLLLPAQSVRLGDPQGDGRVWKVSAPFGREMITVISSKRPLFDSERPEIEDADVYLRALRDVLSKTEHSDMSATLLDVVTHERQDDGQGKTGP